MATGHLLADRHVNPVCPAFCWLWENVTRFADDSPKKRKRPLHLQVILNCNDSLATLLLPSMTVFTT